MLYVRRSNTKAMNTGVRWLWVMYNVQLLVELQEKRTSDEVYSIWIVSSMTVQIFTIAGSSEVRSCPTRKCDPGGAGGNTLESNRAKCYREHQYRNILILQLSSRK